MDDNKIAMQESQDFNSEKFLMERVDLVGLAESFLFYSTIKKENRKQHIVDARHFLYYVGNKKLDIGVCYMQTYLRRMGYGISHPSIIHGVQKVERMLEDTDVKNFVDEVVG